MDYIYGLLTNKYASVRTCYDWHGIIFDSAVSIVTLLALAVSLRRRDRALTILNLGLFLALIGHTIVAVGALASIQDPTRFSSFSAYADAMQPYYAFAKFDRNILQPFGFIVGMWGAITALRRDRRPVTAKPVG